MSSGRFVVELTDQARRDLLDLLEYIERIDPSGVDRWLGNLWEHIETIETFPLAGRARPDIRRGIRSLSCDRTVVLYRVSKKKCSIVAIVDGRRNLSRVRLGR